MAVIAVILVTMVMEETGGVLIAGLFFVILMSAMFGIVTPLALLQAKRVVGKAPTAGLDAFGFQMTPMYFVPYLQMGRTER